MNKLVIKACSEILKEHFITLNPADRLLSKFFRDNHNFGRRDRSYISELYYGVIRNKRYLIENISNEDPKKLVIIYLALILGKSIRELSSVLDKQDLIWLKEKKSNKVEVTKWASKFSLPDWLWEKFLVMFILHIKHLTQS